MKAEDYSGADVWWEGVVGGEGERCEVGGAGEGECGCNIGEVSDNHDDHDNELGA